MQKILVIGCCGAGKSTFSRKLNNIINLELIHLDQYYHKPNWEEPDKEKWEKIVSHLVQKPSWIMDGNYKGTFDVRFKEANTIIYLDYSISRLYINDGNGNFTGVTGINEDMFKEFTISPNPAKNEIFIETSETGLVEIYNIEGRKVLSFEKIDIIQKINIKHLSAGVYFVELNNIIQKFIKE